MARLKARWFFAESLPGKKLTVFFVFLRVIPFRRGRWEKTGLSIPAGNIPQQSALFKAPDAGGRKRGLGITKK
jgi:hypothetical protein